MRGRQWLVGSKLGARFFASDRLHLLFIIIFMLRYNNKEEQQRDWQGINVVNVRTWVRTPGPPCYFNIFLANIFLCSMPPNDHHTPIIHTCHMATEGNPKVEI